VDGRLIADREEAVCPEFPDTGGASIGVQRRPRRQITCSPPHGWPIVLARQLQTAGGRGSVAERLADAEIKLTEVARLRSVVGAGPHLAHSRVPPG